MGSNPNLAALEVGQKEYKGHRRVFDSGIGLFRAQYGANKMTLESLLAVARTKIARIQKDEGDKWMKTSAQDLKSVRRRRARKNMVANAIRNIMALMISLKSH